MPKIGMRIIKTAIAVFLCYLFYLLPGFQQDPMYAEFAAILCMQPDIHSGSKVGINRMLGTVLGGMAGVLVLLLEHQLFGGVAGYLCSAVFSSLMIIPLIYTTVVLKRTSATVITCIVFISITVGHAADVNPFIFSLTRTFNTLVGVFISLGVNAVHLPRHKNKKQLFILELGSTIESGKTDMSNFIKLRLNQLLNDGANIAVMTSRTVAEALPCIKDIHLKLPLIAMNGAVLYDFKQHRYLKTETIDQQTAQKVEEILQKEHKNAFCFTVVNDLMQVYYSFFNSPAEEAYYRASITTPLRSFICGKRVPEHSPIRYMVIDTFEQIHKLRDKLIDMGLQSEISVRIFESDVQKGYYHLEIQSLKVSKLGLLKTLKDDTDCNKVAVFVSHAYNLPILEIANDPFAIMDENDLLQTGRFIAIDHQPKKILKAMEKLLYSRI